MSFEKFYQTEIQERLSKMKWKQVSKHDKLIFEQLFRSLELAEDRVIELEAKVIELQKTVQNLYIVSYTGSIPDTYSSINTNLMGIGNF